MQYWKEICEVHEVPMLRRIVRSCLCLPHGNADIERSFSQINLVMTKNRNSITSENLNKLLFTRSHLVARNLEPWEVEFNEELIKALQKAHSLMKSEKQKEKECEESRKRQAEIDDLRAALEVEKKLRKVPRLEEEEKSLLKEKEGIQEKRKEAEELLRKAQAILTEQSKATHENEKKLDDIKRKRQLANEKVIDSVLKSKRSMKDLGKIPKK